MASVRAGLTSEGALYEAVARGNKDLFFLAKDPESATNPFETRYDPTPPVIHELRRIPPLNGAEFGRSCEFEFETAGDVFVSPTVLIDLPSWLPPTEAALAPTTLITDTASGKSAGYTNGIGYFLFSKIQIFQDKLLLHEYSGDALWASRAARGSLNSAYLENKLAGWHDGSAAAISAAAAPQRLRLELPFLGGPQRGFPSIAMRRQGFKLRLHLRSLEDVVESSDAAATAAPKPWEAASLTVATSPTPRVFKPLARTAIGSPTLQLETRHIYTDGESQLALRSGSWDMPFGRLYENNFTFGPLEYAPLARAATAAVTKRVDAQHPAGRLFRFMRSQNDLRAGRRWKVTPDVSGGEYYANESLIIAGRDRETLSSPFVWGDLTTHAKEDRWPGAGFGEMCWDLGAPAGTAVRERSERGEQPEGTVNFTTADRATLYTELVAVPPDNVLGKPATEMTAVVDTWALYNIEGDRGVLRYGN